MTDERIVSWQPQFQVNGKWLANGYRFDTRERALRFAETVAARRALKGEAVGKTRAVKTADPPNQSD
jgi:hypothetical protein